MTCRILIVCLGNICRSPATEAVVRAKAGALGMAVTIDSAGTSNWHIGEPPYPPMIAAAKARGYDLTSLRARQAVAADFTRFDLILAADAGNLADLAALRPAGNETPLRLFLADDLPDPYYTRDFDGVLRMIEDGANRLLADLDQPRAEQTAAAVSPKDL